MAGGILRCSEVARGPLHDIQVLHLSRLLLLFDYIMKHLYDAPPILLEQVIKLFPCLLLYLTLPLTFRSNGIYSIQQI